MSVIYEIRSASWWKAATWRALRTGISVLVPLLAASSILELNWAVAGSTLALSVVASYLTSLAGLKELTGSLTPKWLALIVRAVKQFAQTAVSFIGASLLITEVDWKSLLVLSASATLVTVAQGLLTVLPETESVVVVDTEIDPSGWDDEPTEFEETRTGRHAEVADPETNFTQEEV